MYEKQSSFFIQAKTAQSIIQGNVFFNGKQDALALKLVYSISGTIKRSFVSLPGLQVHVQESTLTMVLVEAIISGTILFSQHVAKVAIMVCTQLVYHASTICLSCTTCYALVLDDTFVHLSNAVTLGPFNSWDRQPFLTDVAHGVPSMDMAWREIHHNFFIDNYSPQENVDNDDGSRYYKTHDNFFVYGGQGMKNG